MGTPFGVINKAVSGLETGVRTLQAGIDTAVKVGNTIGRALIGIPLPYNVYPIVIPVAGADDPWLASTANKFNPMTFYLNISRNQNLLVQGVSAVTGIVSAFGGPDLDLTGGINTVRGPVDTLEGKGRKVSSFRDFAPLARTSYLPTSVDSIKQAALRQLYVPPLTLLINPSDISYQYGKSLDYSWAQGGNITEYYGNSLLRISANGITPGMYTSKVGLTRRFKTPSLSFQQLMSLYFIYRNNGNDFSAANPKAISIVGGITMYYDGSFYIGSFDNFSISEDSSAPFRFAYSFGFTVRRSTRSYLSDRANVPFLNLPF